MPFRGFLSTYYGVQTEEKIRFQHKEGYLHNNNVYFTTLMENQETIYMEQSALAYYLFENGYRQMTIPITNLQGEWFTPYQEKKYMVQQVHELRGNEPEEEGIALANFHEIGAAYPYQPKEISSYGNWKRLWTDKLTYFEAKVQQEAEKNPNAYYKLWMDILPYFIGITENAIQYVRESEQEERFSMTDQGTMAFNRYTNQLSEPILWMEELVYDHPARDIAEKIRAKLLNGASEMEIRIFLEEYQTVRPLSVFCMRLIYARLLYPAPFFDLMHRGFKHVDVDFSDFHKELLVLIEKQHHYEKGLKHFYSSVGIDDEALNIPVIHWL